MGWSFKRLLKQAENPLVGAAIQGVGAAFGINPAATQAALNTVAGISRSISAAPQQVTPSLMGPQAFQPPRVASPSAPVPSAPFPPIAGAAVAGAGGLGVPYGAMGAPGATGAFGAAGGGNMIEAGWRDVTGQSFSVRGDEVQDTADMFGYVLQGANDVWLRQEARRRRYTRADFNKVMSMQSTAYEAMRLGGLTGLDPASAANIANLVETALRPTTRRRRMPSLRTVLKVLSFTSRLTQSIKRAASGLAFLKRSVVIAKKR